MPFLISVIAVYSRTNEGHMNIAYGCFAPLVFSTSGGHSSPTAKVVYKRIPSLIAEKEEQPYRLTWLHLQTKLLLKFVFEARGPHTINHQQKIFLRAQLVSCALLASKPPHPKFLSFAILSLYAYRIALYALFSFYFVFCFTII